MNTIEKLNKFLDKKDYFGRDYLKELFNVGEYVVATNGYVIAWTLSNEKFENDVPENVTKRIAEWISGHKAQSEFLEFDYSALHDFEESTFKECPKCEGEGEAECFECGHEAVCSECDGDGKVEVFPPFMAIQVTEKTGIQEGYIKLIIDIGGKIFKETVGEGVFLFDAGEISGRVMGCQI